MYITRVDSAFIVLIEIRSAENNDRLPRLGILTVSPVLCRTDPTLPYYEIDSSE